MIDRLIITRLTEEFLASSDCYLVDVAIKPGNLIVVEIDHDNGVSIDDCVALSRHLEEQLDRDEEDFELEVGSAGITSPFKIARQYIKNCGNEVQMILRDGQKITGILRSADETGATITVTRMVKLEGSKRKQAVSNDETYAYEMIKQTTNIIRFK